MQSLFISLHVPASTSELVAGAVAVAAVAALVLLRRRGDDVTFGVAVVAALIATPILWNHYLVLLLAPIALARPRLAPLWLLPLVLWATPHPESVGVVWRIVFVLAVIGVVGQVVRRCCGEPARMSVASRGRVRPWRPDGWHDARPERSAAEGADARAGDLGDRRAALDPGRGGLGGRFALDFRHAFLPAAHAVLHGASPYSAVGSRRVAEGTAFLYPPLSAYLLAPFTLLPPVAAEILAVVAHRGLRAGGVAGSSASATGAATRSRSSGGRRSSAIQSGEPDPAAGARAGARLALPRSDDGSSRWRPVSSSR